MSGLRLMASLVGAVAVFLAGMAYGRTGSWTEAAAVVLVVVAGLVVLGLVRLELRRRLDLRRQR